MEIGDFIGPRIYSTGPGIFGADRISSLAEARGLHRVLGERLRDLPVTATKGALGESLGASGAVATALLVQALGDSTLPGIAGCEHPDPQLPYAGLTTAARPLGAACGLVSARGLEGKSSALVLASPVERAA